MSGLSQTNLAAISAISGVGSATSSLSKTLARIAAARRISSAADLAVGEGLATANRSLTQAMRNTNDGIGLVQTADAASSEVHELLGRMRELAVQSSSGTINDAQRSYLQNEYDALSQEITRIAESTDYLSTSLTDGSTTQVSLQVGVTGNPSSQVDVALGDLTATTLGVTGADVSSQANAQAALDVIDSAINTVSSYRSSYGASLSSLDSALRHAADDQLNLSSAQSSLLDADLALESVQLARDQIQTSTSVAIQVQANRFNAVAGSLI